MFQSLLSSIQQGLSNAESDAASTARLPEQAKQTEPSLTKQQAQQPQQLSGPRRSNVIARQPYQKPRSSLVAAAPGPVDMGCWITSDSQQVSSRKQLDTLFTEPGNSLVHPASVDIRARDPRYDVGPNGQTNGSMTSKWVDYTPQNYNTQPEFASENRLSTGVIVNAYTGKMYETFEEDLPPPTTDKSIPIEQFKKSNHRLIGMQGGYDNNAPRRHKREVCQDIPGEDAGPNVWGDQLYANRRRQEMQTRFSRDIWHNRNGIYSTEAVDDRKPVGFVGYVNTIRPMPYLPATFRTDTASHDYVGAIDEDPRYGPSWETIKPRVTTSKPIYDEIDSRVQCPDASNTAVSDYVVLTTGITQLPGTNRATTGQKSRVGAVDRDTGAIEIGETNVLSLRPTTKTTMSQQFAATNAGAQGAGYTTVIDTDARATQKTMMSGQFPVTTAISDLTTGTGYTTIIDTDARATQKTMMSGQFAAANAGAQGTGYTTIIDTEARPTQKLMMSGAFPVTTVTSDVTTGTGYTTIIDTDARATQKTMMSGQFPVMSAADTASGATIELFQGDLIGTKREHYIDKVHGPFISAEFAGQCPAYGVLGPNLQLDPWRGKTQIDWVMYSQVPLSGGTDTNNPSCRTFMAKPTERGLRQTPTIPGIGNLSDHNAGGALSAWMFLEDDNGCNDSYNMKQGRLGGIYANTDQTCREDLSFAGWYAPLAINEDART